MYHSDWLLVHSQESCDLGRASFTKEDTVDWLAVCTWVYVRVFMYMCMYVGMCVWV